MSIELKIKAMALGAEARIIRTQEQRFLKRLRKRRARSRPIDEALAQERLTSLRKHRIEDVRKEARATCWARAFIAGKPYRLIENDAPLLPMVADQRVIAAANMVLKYGPATIPRRPGDNRSLRDIGITALALWLAVPIDPALKAKLAANRTLVKAKASARCEQDCITYSKVRFNPTTVSA